MADHRIYDRLLERCLPVCFDGESLRREKAAGNLAFYRSLTAER
jgi:DNA replication protein DnaC